MAATKALTALLPEPKYRDDSHIAASREDDSSIETRVVPKGSGPPQYGHRKGWIPRTLEDFGDGGAYPELNVVQYPLELGKKKSV